MPISTVMVSLDGSPFAETALPVAARLARHAGARLRLVMAHEPVVAMVPAGEGPPAAFPEDPALRADEEAYLKGACRRLGTVSGSEVEHALIDGLAGPALVEETERTAPDFLVMATHGRGPWARFWLGSVTDYVVRHASVPLLLLRPHDGETTPASELRFAKGLVPLDRSSDAEAILDPLIEFARVNQASLVLFTVVEPVLGVVPSMPAQPIGPPPEMLDTLRVDALKYLEDVVARLRGEGIAAEAKVVIGLGVAPNILDELERADIDFVAMSTHGLGGVRRLLVGSVADKVIRGASKPVLVTRPEAD